MDWKEKFSRKSVWSELQVQYLMCGINPDEHRGNNECTNEAREEIKDAVTIGELMPAIDRSSSEPAHAFYDEARKFRPYDISTWVDRKIFPAFPFTVDDVRINKRADAGQLTENKEKNLLRTIGALSLLLVKNNYPRFGTENKPNASAISADVIEKLDNLKVPTHGQKKSTYATLIPKAVKLVLDE